MSEPPTRETTKKEQLAILQRRQFLFGGLALGALASSSAGAAGCGVQQPATRTTSAGDVPSTWAAVKAEFSLLDPSFVHMAGFLLASHPRVVREAIAGHQKGFDANPHDYLERNVARCETAVHAAAAEYLGAQPDEVALTDSTTMGLGIVYGGMQLRAGQEILSTTHDHLASKLACSFRAESIGAPFRRVALYEDPSSASTPTIVDAFRRAIRRETRVIAVTWVHSGTGVKLPIRAMADALAEINASRDEADRALLCVDGVHGFGVEPQIAARDLGCDVFVAGCHKWLFGPRGTGIVWAKPAAWSAIKPIIPTFDPMWRKGPPDAIPRAGMMTPGGFHSFEHRWALDAAFRFHLSLGRERVASRIHDLNRHVKEELSKMPRVKVATPRADELSAGMVCFTVDGIAPSEVVARLRTQRVIASVTPPFYEKEYARLCAGLLTLESDVDRTLSAMRAAVTS